MVLFSYLIELPLAVTESHQRAKQRCFYWCLCWCIERLNPEHPCSITSHKLTNHCPTLQVPARIFALVLIYWAARIAPVLQPCTSLQNFALAWKCLQILAKACKALQNLAQPCTYRCWCWHIGRLSGNSSDWLRGKRLPTSTIALFADNNIVWLFHLWKLYLFFAIFCTIITLGFYFAAKKYCLVFFPPTAASCIHLWTLFSYSLQFLLAVPLILFLLFVLQRQFFTKSTMCNAMQCNARVKDMQGKTWLVSS